MIKKDEIYRNINSDYYITKEVLKEQRYGICRYIQDVVCGIDDLNNEIASIAMNFTNFFYVKNCYFNYDKFIIACAAVLLACKKQNTLCKFDQICRRYLEINMKLNGQSTTVIKSEDIAKIKDKICLAEVDLLQCLNFNINLTLSNEHIYVYSVIIYPDNDEDISTYAIKVSNDSYFTCANLLFKNYVVALASILIAARFLNLPSFLDENYCHIKNMKRFYNPVTDSEEEFNKRLLNFENKPFNLSDLVEEMSYFDTLSVYKKIHPCLVIEDLNDCVKMILEFYEDCANNLG